MDFCQQIRFSVQYPYFNHVAIRLDRNHGDAGIQDTDDPSSRASAWMKGRSPGAAQYAEDDELGDGGTLMDQAMIRESCIPHDQTSSYNHICMGENGEWITPDRSRRVCSKASSSWGMGRLSRVRWKRQHSSRSRSCGPQSPPFWIHCRLIIQG